MQTFGQRFDASVEIAHTYAPATLTPHDGKWREEHGVELPVFGEPTQGQLHSVEIARQFSAKPLLVSLVDDIGRSTEEAFFTELSIIEALPTEVFYESAYTEAALEVNEAILKADLPEGYRLSDDGWRVQVGTGKYKLKIPLFGFAGMDDPEHPSCNAHDLAWTLDRLRSIAPVGANILPETFLPQQIKVAALARIFPEFLNYQFTTIFTNPAGNEVSRLDWNNDQLRL
jgi:hypothetical protein